MTRMTRMTAANGRRTAVSVDRSPTARQCVVRTRVATAIPFGIATATFTVAGVLARRDAADYVPVGDAMTDGVNTLGAPFGFAGLTIALLMLALGIRHVCMRAKLSWTDRAAAVGAGVWAAGFLPFVSAHNAPFGPPPLTTAQQLAVAASYLWLCGGGCLAIASLYVLFRRKELPSSRLFDRLPGRADSRADFWIVWIPAALSFIGATALFWISGVDIS